ncbi:O-antigen ligase family protein [Micromonospora sp. NPDC047548]|uniref:O-antigen ligase family protein n=1 Tax=Micromonospora sp. NPDC047548 TaxID=3155624 RepID=UPI0034062DBF
MTSAPVHPVDFEPSLVAVHTYATRRRRTYIDVAALLSIMICLLYLLPARLIVPNLTYVGRPALLLAMLLWCWWLLTRLNPLLVMTGPQPLRWAVLAFLLAAMLSYVAGLLRGLPTLEANAQDFAMLALCQFLGVILVAADGIPNWERLKGVLRVLLWCAGFMAVSALLQSIFTFDITHYLVLPGLEIKGYIIGFENRGEGTGLFRVAGTATHYIEFSSVMAMVVPFAIHFVRFAPSRGHRLAAAVAGLLCAAAIPISISRTGIVALAAAIIVMIPVWPWRWRYNLLILGGVMTVALMVVKPGLLGTLRYMFSGADEDPSIEGRTKDYELVGHWFSQRPWLGRGPRTLVPDLYQGTVLDNQWLYTLVTGGILGVVVLAALHITAITLAGIALRRSTREEDRHLCVALIAAQVIGILVSATYDALAYTTYATTLALLTGFCGAVWRFTHPTRTVRTSTVHRVLNQAPRAPR